MTLQKKRDLPKVCLGSRKQMNKQTKKQELADHKVKNAESDKDGRIFLPKQQPVVSSFPGRLQTVVTRGEEEGTHKLHPVPTFLGFAAAIKIERANIFHEMVKLLP